MPPWRMKSLVCEHASIAEHGEDREGEGEDHKCTHHINWIFQICSPLILVRLRASAARNGEPCHSQCQDWRVPFEFTFAQYSMYDPRIKPIGFRKVWGSGPLGHQAAKKGCCTANFNDANVKQANYHSMVCCAYAGILHLRQRRQGDNCHNFITDVSARKVRGHNKASHQGCIWNPWGRVNSQPIRQI
jgi:hypothetical protein